MARRCQLQPQQLHADQLLGMLLQAVRGGLVPPEGRGGDVGGRCGGEWQKQRWGRGAFPGAGPFAKAKGKGRSVLRPSSISGAELPQGRPGKPAPAPRSRPRDRQDPRTPRPAPARLHHVARRSPRALPRSRPRPPSVKPRRPIRAQAPSCRPLIG